MVEYRYMRILKTLHHWLVPHESNNHRARALHHDALFAAVLMLCVLNLGLRLIHKAAPDVLGFATDIRVEQLLTDTNARRSEEGLPPLTLNSVLSQAAAAKAADMFANNYWSHNSPLGRTPWDFIVNAGYRYTLAGENLAKNFQTSGGVVDAWMASPTHKANIVKEGYRDVGFAVVNGVLNGEETTLVVQMFGTSPGGLAEIPKAQAAAPLNTPAPTTAPAVPAQTDSGSAAGPVTVVPTETTPKRENQAARPADPTVLANGFSFQRFVETPAIDIANLTRNVAYAVGGLFIGLLAVDSIAARRKHIVRLVGHNLTHILFLGSVMVAALAMGRGSLI